MTRVDLQVRSADNAPSSGGSNLGSRLSTVICGECWDDIVNTEHTSNDVACTSMTMLQTHAAYVTVTGTGWPLGQNRR